MKFEKVSKSQWYKTFEYEDNVKILDKMYDDIKLPKRATTGSAGYDFFTYEDITIPPHSDILIPTGIRWVCSSFDNSLVLQIYPRSGLGFKHGIELKNTVGIIDNDFCMAENEGHIMIKLHNPSSHGVFIEKGKGFAQGIITQFFVCDDDEVTDKRTGGFGSTDKK